MVKRGKLLSIVTVLAVTAAFIALFAAADGSMYASAKAKKYALPKEVEVTYLEDDSKSSLTKIKYDKYGNIKSALISEMIPMKYKVKYRNKKGVISKATFTDGDAVMEKTYDKKGRLKKVKIGSDTYKYSTNKKGIIKKVTLNGKTYYKVKSIKFHKNGFAKKVVYSNGNVNKYNKDGLMTFASEKGGSKYTYKYTKKSGKVVKVIVKRDGVKYKQINLKYGKSKTKDVWKYSTLVNYADGPSNATELYSKCALSGANALNWD